MEFLICLWLLALITRLDGRDTCGLCAKVSKPTLHAERHGWQAARSRH